MAYGLSPCGYVSCQFFWRLKTLMAPFCELTEVDPYFLTLTAPVFRKSNLTRAGKPKPFSSADERDVEPCF
jgi:hypothetical protein